MANVSIIMVSYHTGPILSRAIEAAIKQEGLQELIIIDNGNPDEIRGELRSWADREPKLRYITGHGNVGFAAGCNIGAKNARGEYLLFLNPDCVIAENTITRIVKVMKKHKDAWLAGCCLMGPEGRREANNKRNLLSPEVAMSEVFRLWKFNEQKFPRINIVEATNDELTSYVPAISGAFMLIKRKRYLEIGGMDESYFFHVEDLDFCKEIKVQGGKVIYVPSIKAIHHRSSSDVTSFFVEYYKTKGFIRYFNKHYRNIFYGLFIYLLSFAVWGRFLIRAPKILLREHQRKRRPKTSSVNKEQKVA